MILTRVSLGRCPPAPRRLCPSIGGRRRHRLSGRGPPRRRPLHTVVVVAPL